MKYVVCPHLCIPWKFGERRSTPGGDRRPRLSFFLSACPSRYVARHRKPRRCVYVLTLGGTGIRPPDSFSYRSNFRFRSSFRSRSSFSSTTSGDIFYCSGSRQSSCYWNILVRLDLVVSIITLRPSIWLMAADSLSVHSSMTFCRISFINNMKALRGFLM